MPLTTRRDSSRRDFPGDLRLSSKVSGVEGSAGDVSVRDIVMVCVVAILIFSPQV